MPTSTRPYPHGLCSRARLPPASSAIGAARSTVRALKVPRVSPSQAERAEGHHKFDALGKDIAARAPRRAAAT